MDAYNPIQGRRAAMEMGLTDPEARPKGPTNPMPITRTKVSSHVTVINNNRTASRTAPGITPATPETVTPKEDVHPDLLPSSNGERHVAKGNGQTPIPFSHTPMQTNNVIYGGTHNHYYGGVPGNSGGSHFDNDYHLLHPELNSPLTRAMKAGANLGETVKGAATSGAEAHQLRQLGSQRRTH